jgi:hypothetical protein
MQGQGLGQWFRFYNAERSRQALDNLTPDEVYFDLIRFPRLPEALFSISTAQSLALCSGCPNHWVHRLLFFYFICEKYFTLNWLKLFLICDIGSQDIFSNKLK